MKRKNGFTLIELLVVVAIIAVLIAILLPALSSARSEAKAVLCGSNARQIYMANLMYANEWNDFIVFHDPYPPDSGRWGIKLAKYLQPNAPDTWDAWPYGLTLCPSNNNRLTPGEDVKLQNANLNLVCTLTMTQNGGPRKLDNPGDACQGIFLSEGKYFDMVWHNPFAYPFNSRLQPKHNGRANVVYLDGSRKILKWQEIPIFY